GGQEGVAVAGGGADDGRQVDDDVGAGESLAHQDLVADVALDEVEGGVGTEVEQSLLPGAVHQVVNGLDAVAPRQEVLTEDAAEVAEGARHEDLFRHAYPPWCCWRGGRGHTPNGFPFPRGGRDYEANPVALSISPRLPLGEAKK